MYKPKVDFMVGIFVLVALFALVVLAFRVSGLVHFGNSDTYMVSAEFDNIGGLQARGAVRIGGVTIGKVQSIGLDPKTFRAKVTMQIFDKYNTIPDDSSANIYTQGLLGANYVNIVPGFDSTMLKNDGVIGNTTSAMILENLIGQFLFNAKGGDKKDKTTTATTTPAPAAPADYSGAITVG